MKRIILIAIFIKVMIVLFYFLTKSEDEDLEKNDTQQHPDIDFDSLSNALVNIGQLENCRLNFPFARWRLNAIEHGITQYSQENCEAIELVFDELIADLKVLPENASAEDKVLLFKYAVLATNTMNNRIDGFIETGEREDLCELMDQISIAAGLEPEEFADGEGIASEWREW